jgi:hypothetical protein
MSAFTRREIAQLLEIDEGFVTSLERESIIHVDNEDVAGGETFSALMVERVRVAHSLVHELEINLAGVAVIVRMREELGTLRAQVHTIERIWKKRDPDRLS